MIVQYDPLYFIPVLVRAKRCFKELEGGLEEIQGVRLASALLEPSIRQPLQGAFQGSVLCQDKAAWLAGDLDEWGVLDIYYPRSVYTPRRDRLRM